MIKKSAQLFNRMKGEDKENYYTIAPEKLDQVKYLDMTMKSASDIYLMRQFQNDKIREIFEGQLSENQRYYRENGYLVLKNFIPHDIIDRYLSLREQLNLGRRQFPRDGAPHVDYQCIRDIASYGPLNEVILELHSMEMGLIFALTGFKSTQRGWHQDAYFDSDDALPRCASWIALGEVDADCGPFELIPGSHRWPALSNQAINHFIKKPYHWPDGHTKSINGAPRWGKLTEALIDPSVNRKIAQENLPIKQFIAEKGDVLIWHGRLMHRGSRANDEQATRPSLIGHYAPLGEKKRGLFAKRKDNSYFLVPPRNIAALEGATDLC